MIFTKYDEQGRILFHGDVPENLIDAQGENVCIGYESSNTHFVKDGAFSKRNVSPVRIGNDKTLQNIPIGAVIFINDQAYPAVDPVCSIEFTYPGIYRIRVECFPYLDFETEVVQ